MDIIWSKTWATLEKVYGRASWPWASLSEECSKMHNKIPMLKHRYIHIYMCFCKLMIAFSWEFLDLDCIYSTAQAAWDDNIRLHRYIQIRTHIYTYIYMCTYICMYINHILSKYLRVIVNFRYVIVILITSGRRNIVLLHAHARSLQSVHRRGGVFLFRKLFISSLVNLSLPSSLVQRWQE